MASKRWHEKDTYRFASIITDLDPLFSRLACRQILLVHKIQIIHK